MMDHYVLDEKEPRKVDFLTWAMWWENRSNRRVAFTEMASGVEVSTIFMGIDHNWHGGTPILFETMVNSDYGWDMTVRYATWAEAEVGHMEMVERIEAMLAESIRDPA